MMSARALVPARPTTSIAAIPNSGALKRFLMELISSRNCRQSSEPGRLRIDAKKGTPYSFRGAGTKYFSDRVWKVIIGRGFQKLNAIKRRLGNMGSSTASVLNYHSVARWQESEIVR